MLLSLPLLWSPYPREVLHETVLLILDAEDKLIPTQFKQFCCVGIVTLFPGSTMIHTFQLA